LYTYTSQKAHTTGFKTGLHIGTALDITAGKNVSILTELNYNRLGGNDKGKSYLETVTTIDYFSIPLLFKYNFETGLSFYTGPQIAFSTNAEVENVINKKDIDATMNEVELAAVFGAEYKFKSGVFFTTRYNLGLTNIVKREFGNTDVVKNRGITLAIGYYFGKK
jgi:Outer membrane protein beta-barrel domain